MITALIRTIILYLFIMIGMRLMGKRQIGELEPSELVLTMMISDLAAVPMQDIGIPLLCGLIPILTLLALSLLLSQLSLHSLRLRRLICGTPSVLIRDGVLQQQAMRDNRFTLDELLEKLRGQGFSQIQQVKYALLETSGQLSVLPYAAQQPPTAQALGLSIPPEEEASLPVILINDGQIMHQGLRACGKDARWLDRELGLRGISAADQVFLLTLDQQDQIFCVKKEVLP